RERRGGTSHRRRRCTTRRRASSCVWSRLRTSARGRPRWHIVNILVTNTHAPQAYAVIRALRPYAEKIVATVEGDNPLRSRRAQPAGGPAAACALACRGLVGRQRQR